MCDVLSGGSRNVRRVTGKWGSKLAKNSVTYFMDGPLDIWTCREADHLKRLMSGVCRQCTSILSFFHPSMHAFNNPSTHLFIKSGALLMI